MGAGALSHRRDLEVAGNGRLDQQAIMGDGRQAHPEPEGLDRDLVGAGQGVVEEQVVPLRTGQARDVPALIVVEACHASAQENTAAGAFELASIRARPHSRHHLDRPDSRYVVSSGMETARPPAPTLETNRYRYLVAGDWFSLPFACGELDVAPGDFGSGVA